MASKPRSRARSRKRSNFRWALQATHGFGVRPCAWPATYGSTTSRSNSEVKLNTWWAMPSCWATRRASSTSATEQQPESDGPPHNFIVAPDDLMALVVASAPPSPTSPLPPTWPPGRALPTPPYRQSGGGPNTGHMAAALAPVPPLARATAAGTTCRARSTSASVVVCPSVRRRAPRACDGEYPIAKSTWLGSMAPLAQADPAEAATPSSSSTTSRASLSTPSMRR